MAFTILTARVLIANPKRQQQLQARLGDQTRVVEFAQGPGLGHVYQSIAERVDRYREIAFLLADLPFPLQQAAETTIAVRDTRVRAPSSSSDSFEALVSSV